MKKQFWQGVKLFILFLVLTGCSEKQKDVSPEQAIWDEVAFWSSEEFEGRQAGTAANEKVRNEIEQRFKKIGLQTVLGDSYSQPFPMLYLNSDEIEKRFVVHMKDGTEKEFLYGEDWMEKSPEPKTYVDLPISFTEEKHSIFVTEKQRPPSEESRIQLVKSDQFKKVLTSYSESSSFQISESLFNFLRENEDEIQNVGLIYSGSRTPSTAHNVIGKIAGENKDEKRAIVISAHFDHVGKAGSNTFLGSIDNATGLTALLNISKELTEQAKKQSFSSDIIFAAFNAEESGLLGSNVFVNEISSQYDSIANINLDCIGYKEGGKVTLSGSNSESANLSEMLTELAEGKDVQVHRILEDVISLRSDHASFLDRQFQAINLSQEKYPVIHSIEDNMDQVDAGPILIAIDLVVDFVIKHHDDSFPPVTMNTYDRAYEMEYMRHLKELKFGEYKTYQSEVTNNLDTVLNLERNMTSEESQLFSSEIENNGLKLVSAFFLYKPKDIFGPTNDEIGVIKQLSNEEIEKDVIRVEVEKQDEKLNIQIISREVELPFNGEPEVVGEWKFWTNELGSGDRFSSAVKTMIKENQIFTILIQGTFTKDTLSSFEQTFPIDTAIKLFNP